MNRVRETLKRIFCLPLLPTVCIAVPAFGLVIYVLIEEINGPLAYASYAVSAYALAISILWPIRAGRAVREQAERHPIAGRYLNDAKYRTGISLHLGFFINLLYIAMKLISGICYRSWWFITLAVYYALLAAMRLMLLWRWARISPEAELHRYRLCGVILLMMNVALAGMVILMIHQNQGYDYPGTLIYAMAAYSFYAAVTAVVNLVRLRRHASPVLSAAKTINLVAAMVSILSLETAMLARFGSEDGPEFRNFMTGATGGGICAIVLGMAVLMILKPAKDIRRNQFQSNRKE